MKTPEQNNHCHTDEHSGRSSADGPDIPQNKLYKKGLYLEPLYPLGIWQADAIAGIIIVLFLMREGLEIWRESKEE